MLELGHEELVTLELVASDGDHVVIDKSALERLSRRGLVEFRRAGWTVTMAGREIARALAARR